MRLGGRGVVEGFAVGFGLQAAFVPGCPRLVCFFPPYLAAFLAAFLTAFLTAFLAAFPETSLSVAFSKYHDYLYGGECRYSYRNRRAYSLGDCYDGV